MSNAILIIEYELGEAQQTLTPEAWQARAQQIASIEGLDCKYWLRTAATNDRGGVYLFETIECAERGSRLLVASLEGAGARGVRHRIYEVDRELSRITKGTR